MLTNQGRADGVTTITPNSRMMDGEGNKEDQITIINGEDSKEVKEAQTMDGVIMEDGEDSSNQLKIMAGVKTIILAGETHNKTNKEITMVGECNNNKV